MDSTPAKLNRRGFLTKSAKAGLVLGAPGVLRASVAAAPSDTINVAMVGSGRWGNWIHDHMRNIPGIRIQAVCDIWDYQRKKAQVLISRYQNGERPNTYVDLEEMLGKESGLDAAIVATPDFWHAPHAIRCMEAGLHVYCESMMAHTLDAAREIVRASERTGKLCQIGHQHRSSAVYRYCRDRLLHKYRICGKIHNINSQWNTSVNALGDIRFNPRLLVEEDALRRYGYENMHALLNWRHNRAHSQGNLAFFTARQMDVIHWFLDAVPTSVTVNAGRDFFKQREQFDNLMCIFQYDMPHGTVRAFHQSLTTMNDPEIRYEKFIGPDATLRIAGAGEFTEIRNKTSADESGYNLAQLAKRNIIRPSVGIPCYLRQENVDTEMGVLSHESTPPIPYELPGRAPRPPLEAHLMNFFDAIHGRAELNCDARTAFASEAAMYWLHAAGESRGTHRFTPEQIGV
jgi:predicted dehydrogenase